MSEINRTTTMKTVPAAILAAALAGCGEADRVPDEEPQPVVRTTEATAGLPPGTIQQLAQEYPVLRDARAPAPAPSADATPGQVPARVEEALPPRVLERVTGEATFYADTFEGRRTASGIPFRQNQMVAAHRAYPFGTVLRVTNTRNDRSVTVRVVDRGPHGARAAARNTIIDLSRRAAERLDYTAAGRTPVSVEVLEWGDGLRAG